MDAGRRGEGDGRRSAAIAACGAVVEWYDFSLYIYLAPIYGRVFFTGDDAASRLLATFAVFAVAYVGRPLGALVFGHYGDRRGRRQSSPCRRRSWRSRWW
jgi:MHS family proline/betaine transporter-like MFS transporter